MYQLKGRIPIIMILGTFYQDYFTENLSIDINNTSSFEAVFNFVRSWIMNLSITYHGLKFQKISLS